MPVQAVSLSRWFVVGVLRSHDVLLSPNLLLLLPTSDPPAASWRKCKHPKVLGCMDACNRGRRVPAQPYCGETLRRNRKKAVHVAVSDRRQPLVNSAQKKKYPLNALERELVGCSTSVISRQHCHLLFHAKLLTPPPPPPPPTWSIMMDWCALNKISYNEHCNESRGRTQPFHLDAFG